MKDRHLLALLYLGLFFLSSFFPKTQSKTIQATENCSQRERCSEEDYPYCIPNVDFNDCSGIYKCWDGNILESIIGDCTYKFDPNQPTPTLPPFTETDNNCNNRGGHCPKDLYPECTENVEYQNCSGPNFCSIPYYIPMGTVGPYNLVACASKTSAEPPTTPIGSPSNCPVCPKGFTWIAGYQSCQKSTHSGTKYEDPKIVDCSSSTNKCYPGHGCTSSSTTEDNITCDSGNGVQTALGCIPTDPRELVKWVFPYLLGLGGLSAFSLIVFSGIQILTSGGNPEKIQGAKETITSAVTGLLFIILSLFLLRLIGVDVLELPGLS